MKKLRVLLFSISGSGNFYNGPGQTAYRTFSSIKDHDLEFHLLHCNVEQPVVPMFKSQNYIDTTSFPLSLYLSSVTLNPVIQWLVKNRDEYDVIFGLSGMLPISIPMSYMRIKYYKPTIIKLVTHKSDLIVKNRMKKILFFDKIKRYFLRKIDRIVCISSDIHDEALSLGFNANKLIRIPNGVDVKKFCPSDEKDSLRLEFGVNSSCALILFVGALYSRKQPHLLIDAIKELSVDSIDNIKVLLIGPSKDGEYSDSILEKVDKYDWLEHVEFSSEVEKYYSMADVFVLPSIREGFSNAILEAMSSELIVFSRPISGAKDVISDGDNGFLFSDLNELKIKLASVLPNLKNSELISLKMSARKTIESGFSSGHVANCYAKEFKRLYFEKNH